MPESTAHHRSFRVRWWMWVILVVLVGLAALSAVRIAGQVRLRETLAEVRARGLPVTPVELLALAPAIDADRQRRLGPYVRQGSFGGDWGHLPFYMQSEKVDAKSLQKTEAKMLAGAAFAAEVGSILDEGPVCISVYGYCERDPAKLAHMDLAELASQPSPNLMSVRDYANWWAVKACTEADPIPHLRRLDQWQAALRRPGWMIDAMIAIAASSIRDDTYLWLATRGRLDAQQLQAWQHETPEQRRMLADSFGFERAWFWDALSRMPLVPAFGTGLSGDNIWERLGMGLRIWPLLGYDCAYSISAMTNQELAMRGLPPMSGQTMPWGIEGVLTAVMTPNLAECTIMAVESENTQRLKRLAASVAIEHRRRGVLPTLADLPAELLAGNGPDLPPLRYETFPPHRFRIGIDPAGPLPPLIPVGRWAGKDYASAIGSAPAKTPQGPAHTWSLELDLEAILIPPPEKVKAKTP